MMSTSSRRVVIVHGTGGNPAENWFPWLAAQVRALGAEAVVPQFPTPEGQTPEAWLERLAAATPPIDGSVVLVGHSLGCAFILRLLEQVQAPVAGCILVSGFVGTIGNEMFDPLNAPFFVSPIRWDRVREHVGEVALFHGGDDPYVPRAKAEELAGLLSAPLHIVSDGGHLNTAAGYTEFPAVLDNVSAFFGHAGAEEVARRLEP